MMSYKDRTLSEIYDCLKSNNIYTDKGSVHCYCSNFYEKQLCRFRHRKTSILEIGVKSGASLILWDEYFDDVEITGIDIDLKRLTIIPKSNMKIIEANAYSEEIFNYIKPSYDVIIDDGPHTVDSQIKFIELYSNRLNVNGILIIEDIQTERNCNEIISHISSNLQYEVFDLRKIKNRYDDLLLVIRKDKFFI